MEYQQIINLLDNTSKSHLDLQQRIELKLMMNIQWGTEEHKLLIVKLNLKL